MVELVISKGKRRSHYLTSPSNVVSGQLLIPADAGR
jgi:hypothetical protein